MVRAPLPSHRDGDSKARLRLWVRLLRAARIVEAATREKFKREFNVTVPRFDVMAALARKPEGMLMSEISRFLLVSNGNVTVGTFTRGSGVTPASQFSVSIDWGDGSTSAGTVTSDGQGGWLVSGSHLYAEEGSYAVGLTITDMGGGTAQAGGTATLADAPLTAGGRNIAATNTFDFTGVFFDGGEFTSARFSGGTVRFDRAEFSSGSVDYRGAEFSGGTVRFDRAEFYSASVHFRGAGFSRTGCISLATGDISTGVLPSGEPRTRFRAAPAAV